MSTSNLPKSSPPRGFGLGQLTKHNVGQLRELLLATIPVVYGEEVYQQILENPEYSRLAYLGDIMVGAITCRLTGTGADRRLYVITLSVLKPYRNLGVASYLLSYIMDLAVEAGDIRSLYLHVPEQNTSAISFYKHRGFSITTKVENYYDDLPNSDAYVMEAELTCSPRRKTETDETSFDATKHNLAVNV